jgi:hypothetical protein
MNLEAVLAEYSALRAEIIQMEQIQSNVFVLQLTAIAAILSFSLSSHARTGFLLIVPVVSYALSRRYLLTDEIMNRISTYIAEELAPKTQGDLGWEEWNRTQVRQARLRRQREPRLYQRFSDLIGPVPLVFAWISVLALIWVVPYILYQHDISVPTRLILGAIWILGFIISMRTLNLIHLPQRLPLWHRGKS